MLETPEHDGNAALRRALRSAAPAPTADQQELRAALSAYLADGKGTADLLDAPPTGVPVDRAAWRRFATEQGLVGLAVAEAEGGAGYTFAELAVVCEELGAGLDLPAFPFIASGVTDLLVVGAQPTRDRYLGELLAGELLVGLDPAVLAPAPQAQPVARPVGDGEHRLSGSVPFVVGSPADLDVLLLVASAPDGPVLLACPLDQPAVDSRPMAVMDLTRPQTTYVLDDAAALVVLQGEQLAPALSDTRDRLLVALAAEQVGGAGRALELAVRYAQERHQFGRPVGSFQAVKHKCAEMLVELEAARSALSLASWACAQRDVAQPLAAAVASAAASDAFRRISAEAVQVHGGMGFSWEHPVHHYFRRARADEAMVGGAAGQRARVARMLGLGEAGATRAQQEDSRWDELSLSRA